MAQGTVIVKVRGLVSDVLNRLVEMGVYETRSEAIRAGILKLGQEYGLANPIQYYKRKLDEALAKATKVPSYEEVMHTIREVRSGRR